MRRTLLSIKPDRFEDIIALVALFRPGPMSNIPRFAAIKHGHEEPDYMHPLLEPVLKETHGIIVYQEQVMEIARVLSGFSLAEADMLRRAMGKKIRSEMDKQKSRFCRAPKSAAWMRALSATSLKRWPNSPTTASTNRTLRPMRWSPIKRRI
jgi:DNA polymerase-3 subunit alpha